MTIANPKQSPLSTIGGIIGGIIGAIVGVALSGYSGPNLLVPGATAFSLFLIFDRTSIRPAYFRGAVTLILAHVTWFVAAAIVLGTWQPVIIDVVALGVGVVWIWLRPGLIPCIFLGIVELVTLGINLNVFMAANFGSEAHRALCVHLVLRIGAIAFLAVGYLRLKADRTTLASVRPSANADQLQVTCEECRAVMNFPVSLNGTVQRCLSCRAYVDVGQSDCDVDVGEPEDA